jgi:nucleotide-binding universal stress UspA family protein
MTAEPVERLLVSLDGSVLAETVMPVVEALAREHEAELILLRVIDPQVSPAFRDDEVEAETYLGRLRRRLEEDGLRHVRSVVATGAPDATIAETAEYHRADLIAMATHGRSGLGRVLIGSVAQSVVRRASAPVLLVHGRLTWQPGRAREVLVPLDGSPTSEAIVGPVERLAGPLDFTIHLLHVVETPPGRAEAAAAAGMIRVYGEQEARRYLDGLTERLQGKGLRVRSSVRVGRAIEAIPASIAEDGIGLVAMSTHGRTGLGRLLVGSVAEHVLGAVTVPVVLWRPRRLD